MYGTHFTGFCQASSSCWYGSRPSSWLPPYGGLLGVQLSLYTWCSMSAGLSASVRAFSYSQHVYVHVRGCACVILCVYVYLFLSVVYVFVAQACVVFRVLCAACACSLLCMS